MVVLTGASSGIGRATALELAARGACLTLIARDRGSLSELAAECAARGAEPLIVAADVTDPDALEAAADQAVARFGRIDAWVNGASVMQFGPFTTMPLADLRRVLEVNLLGYVHGCRSALRRMIAQEHGVVVNIGSLLGVVALPYGAAYTMAKFAVRGLGGSLRQELRLSGVSGVSVCTVLPGPVDTPIFDNAANHTGRRARALPPVASPERVARLIVRMLRRPRPEVVAGGLLDRLFFLMHRATPRLAERVLAAEADRFALSRTETAPAGSGNLYAPAPGPGRVRAGWRPFRWIPGARRVSGGALGRSPGRWPS